MAQEQNFSSFDKEYARSRKRPWFAVIVGAQIALMLAFFLLNGHIAF
jgi:hypothetical protein